MGELLILVGICGVLGLGAWIVERPKRAESISDAQTTSEKGLW